MSIAVPPSTLPPSSPTGLLGTPSQGSQATGGDGVPSEQNMLMALAEMHKMDRLKSKPNMKSIVPSDSGGPGPVRIENHVPMDKRYPSEENTPKGKDLFSKRKPA